MWKVEGGRLTPPPSRLRVTIFSSRLLELIKYFAFEKLVYSSLAHYFKVVNSNICSTHLEKPTSLQKQS